MRFFTVTLATLSVVSLSSANAQDIQGTYTIDFGTFPGSFDFFIDTSSDTMVVSNFMGDLANVHGFLDAPLILQAHNDFTITGEEAANQASPLFDFTGNEENPLGLLANDGFYWAATTTTLQPNPGNVWNNFVIGGGIGLNTPISDSPQLSFVTNTIGGNAAVGHGQNSTLAFEVIPEPSSALLCLVSSFALLKRRR